MVEGRIFPINLREMERTLYARRFATWPTLRVLFNLPWYDPKDVVLETRIFVSLAHVLSLPLLLIVAYATAYPF